VAAQARALTLLEPLSAGAAEGDFAYRELAQQLLIILLDGSLPEHAANREQCRALKLPEILEMRLGTLREEAVTDPALRGEEEARCKKLRALLQ